MLYTTLKIKDNEYKLRLTAKASVDLEKKLGSNPLNVLMSISENNLPSMDTIISILHASLQAYQHSITLDDTYTLYDDMVDEGNTLENILPVIIDIFKVSGFIKESKAKEKN